MVASPFNLKLFLVIARFSLKFNFIFICYKKKSTNQCTLEEFAVHFLTLIKSQTDEFITKGNSSTCNTPKKVLGTADTSINEANQKLIARELFLKDNDSLTVNKVEKLTTLRNVSANDFANESQTEFESEIGQRATSSSFLVVDELNRTATSTPVLNYSQKSRTENSSLDLSGGTRLSLTRKSLDKTFNANTSRTSKRNNNNSSLCLGDFITTSTSGRNKKKNSSQQHNDSMQSDNSSLFPKDAFPPLSSDKLTTTGNNKKPTVSKEDVVVPAQIKVKPKSSETQTVKPKKRVVPITLSTTIAGGTYTTFTSSSLHGENNLTPFMQHEAEQEPDQNDERLMLKNYCKETISKDFLVEQEPKRNLHALIKENLPVVGRELTRKDSLVQYDEEKIVGKEIIEKLSRIYALILDLNLVPNILTELAFLINLLNSDIDPFEHRIGGDSVVGSDSATNILKNLNNCIYFALKALNFQKHVLVMLDLTTIRVLIDNERIQTCSRHMYDFLKQIHLHKTQLEAASPAIANKSFNSSFNSVFYQQDIDNRDNFPSDKEFGAFKKQRDIFYSILRTWEFKHLNPSWEFGSELGWKVRSLLTILEHPINMAHLAKLFTAQLIISCNFDNTTQDLQMELPNVDLSRLSKLRQRLVAPSLFSTQYLFPGNQAFFRDFILACDQKMIFLEQLKVALISELMEVNDSSFDVLKIVIPKLGNKKNEEETTLLEFKVRAETMATMRVLSKFIGFVISLPFSYDGYRNVLVDQRQAKIRNKLHPDFDIKGILQKSIDEKKYIVTIPWLVEYLTMLDYVTIRLDYYREMFKILLSLYMKMNITQQNQLALTSKFIVRSCLGWLFEHPNIPEEYFSYQKEIDVKEFRDSKDLPVSDNLLLQQLDPFLESILDAACPFLADFRVAVMPSKISKTVSRSGRYRHITTKYSGDSTVSHKSRTLDNHQRLVEAFLQSQSLSVRKTIDFVIERVASAAIKDFQVKYLLDIRKFAKDKAENITLNNFERLLKKMYGIYQDALEEIGKIWDTTVPTNIKRRVRESLEALLPCETMDEVKKALISLTIEKTLVKVNDWRLENIMTIEIFTKDIHSDAKKLFRNGPVKVISNQTVIDLNAMATPSFVFDEFQNLLYLLSLKPAQVELKKVEIFLDLLLNVLERQQLISNGYKNVAFQLLQIALLIVCNRCDLLTKIVLAKFMKIWKHKHLLKFTIEEKEAETTEEYPMNEQERLQITMKITDFVFSNVISCRFLIILQSKSKANFECFAQFIGALINANFMTLENVNEQCVTLYKEEWCKETLDNIAFFVQKVSVVAPPTKSIEDVESKYFMDLVADLALDMENY